VLFLVVLLVAYSGFDGDDDTQPVSASVHDGQNAVHAKVTNTQ
jgi:hypothetical protein